MQLIKHVDCSWELTAAEIWTKCLFTSQFGSCQERPASGLHSLRWNVAAALRLPNQTAAFFFLPSSLFFFCLFFWVGVLFVSVATGGFILQDRTYHSLTGGGGNEMVLSNDWMKKTDFFPSKLRVIFSPKKEKKEIQMPQMGLSVTNDYNQVYCWRTMGLLCCQRFLASGSL